MCFGFYGLFHLMSVLLAILFVLHQSHISSMLFRSRVGSDYAGCVEEEAMSLERCC